MEKTETVETNGPHDLFAWGSGVESFSLQLWTERHGWELPRDLLNFWQEVGGGEMFGSEHILRPLADGDGDDVAVFNEKLRELGLPRSYMVFHHGQDGLSAVRLDDGAYVTLDRESFGERGVYGSLRDWYLGLRLRYAERFGLRA